MFQTLIRSIFERFSSKREKRVLIITIVSICVLCVVMIVSLTVTSYLIAKQVIFNGLQERLVNLTSIAPFMVDADLVEKYRNRLDSDIDEATAKNIEQEPDYKKLFSEVDTIRKSDPETITCVYVLVATKVKEKAKFVVDCDLYDDREKQRRGEVYTTIAQIGYEYDISEQPETMEALSGKKQTVSGDFIYDKEWDMYSLMGFHPIYSNGNGEFLGVI